MACPHRTAHDSLYIEDSSNLGTELFIKRSRSAESKTVQNRFFDLAALDSFKGLAMSVTIKGG
ncbi:hypothetical protein AGMMS50256_29330 [Betaproteobacteria bacterium]|nr:hypothetical protein AGMMS50256_29330 [Betaproteobacteria bacterium]